MPIGVLRPKGSQGVCKVRVISGTLRGLKLNTLSGTDTRPTLDRVKEALFSMLFDRVADSIGLDLFAGSGALGIELLSRYGKECVFVDSSLAAVEVVKSNISKARLEDKSLVITGDAVSFVKGTDKKFDIIFLDPPYKSGLYEQILAIIKERNLLNPDGVVVCECSPDCDFSLCGFVPIKDKTYGKVRLLVLEEE